MTIRIQPGQKFLAFVNQDIDSLVFNPKKLFKNYFSILIFRFISQKKIILS